MSNIQLKNPALSRYSIWRMIPQCRFPKLVIRRMCSVTKIWISGHDSSASVPPTADLRSTCSGGLEPEIYQTIVSKAAKQLLGVNNLNT